MLIYKVFCLKGFDGDEKFDYLLENLNFKKNSYFNLINNLQGLSEVISDSREENCKLFNYILNKCEIGCISVGDLAVAFQLFDSQNSRGKILEPHDILKAFHLRMWKPSAEKDKKNLCKYISFWNCKVDCIKKYVNLRSLFSDYLYPIIQWTRNYDGINFTKDDADIFRGVNINNNAPYNYEKFYSAINKNIDLNQFVYLLNQDIIQGEFFFNYVMHYINLIENLKFKLKQLPDYKEHYKILFTGVKGNKITGRMWINLLLLLIDRFNFEILNDDAIVKKTFKWAASIRLKNYSVSDKAINKYALGKSSINNFNYFSYTISINNKEKVLSKRIDYLKKSELTRVTKDNNSENPYSKLYDYCFGVANES